MISLCAYAQVVGPNIDVIQFPNQAQAAAAHNPPAVDMLNRQLETDVAASPLNPARAIAAFNDYRFSLTTFDTWCGWAYTKNGGDTWKNFGLPDLPATPIGPGNFCTDPAVVWDVFGNAYMLVLGGTRGNDTEVFSVKIKPKNDASGDLDANNLSNSIVLIDVGLNFTGQGLDKPSIAYTPPSAAYPNGILHASYAIFDGSASRSKVMYARSVDGGVTYSKPVKINNTLRRCNNTAMAISPMDGALYVSFVNFDSTQAGVYIVKSTDAGQSWGSPIAVATLPTFYPYHQVEQTTVGCSSLATCPLADRSLAIPALTVDGKGQVLIGFQEYVNTATGLPTSPVDSNGQQVQGVSPRIVFTASADGGQTWSGRLAGEVGPSDAYQIKPRLAFSGGVASVLFEDARGGGCNFTIIPSLGAPLMNGINCKRNIRVMQADLTNWNASSGLPSWGASIVVTQFPKNGSGQVGDRASNCAGGPGSCPADYEPMDPSSASGTTPFTGDYIGIAPTHPLIKDSSGNWRQPMQAADPRSFYAVWDDNRWQKFPVNSRGNTDNTANWAAYDPTTTCVNPGTRNYKPFFAKVSPGLVAFWSGTDAQVSNGAGPVQPRLVLTVQNLSNTDKLVRLTIADGPPAEDWSFSQAGDVNALETKIGAFSSTSRTVSRRASSTNPVSSASVRVLVQQIASFTGANAQPNFVTPDQGGSATSITFNVSSTTVQANGSLHDLSVACDATGSCQSVPTNFKKNTQASSTGFESTGFESTGFESTGFESTGFESTALPDQQVTWQVTGTGILPTSSNSLTNLQGGFGMNSGQDLLQDGYLFQLLFYRTYVIVLPNACTLGTGSIDRLVSSVPITQPNGQKQNKQISNTGFESTGFESTGFESTGFESTGFESSAYSDSQLSNSSFYVDNGDTVKLSLRSFKSNTSMLVFNPTPTDGAASEGVATQTLNTDGGTQKTSFDDKSPPSINSTVSPPPNSAGWYCNANPLICPVGSHPPVTVAFTAVDPGSGVTTSPGCTPAPLTSETTATGTVLTCAATNGGGVSNSLAVTVKIDLTPPAIAITTPANGATYLLNQTGVNANYACTDPLSGVATCMGPVTNGSAINTSTVGANNFTVNAGDIAGNQSSLTNSYKVIYKFTGFFSPLSAPDQYWGAFNLGSAVPIKYQLSDVSGVLVSDLTSLASITAYFMSSPSGGTCPVPSSFTGFTAIPLFNPGSGATGGSTFKWDPKNQQFVFSWDTSTGVPTGKGCYALGVQLKDGTLRKGSLQLK